MKLTKYRKIRKEKIRYAKMNKLFIVIPLVVAIGFLIFPFVVYYGNDIMVITSDSMVPALMPHDLIIVEPVGIDEIKEGDIIAFDSHMQGIGIIAHRAIAVGDDDGQTGIDTKGDNVEEPDPWTVHEEDLVGKVIDIIPTMGIFLIDPVRYTLVAVIIITALSLLKDVTSETKKATKKSEPEEK